MTRATAVLLIGIATLAGASALSRISQGAGNNAASAAIAAESELKTRPIPGGKLTEEQAQHLMEKRGYTVGGHLVKDDKGLWHADALKGGRPTHIMVNARGTVVESKTPAEGKPTS
jgi:hypothetical protein